MSCACQLINKRRWWWWWWCTVTSRLLTRGHYLVKYFFLFLQWNLNTYLRVKFEGVGWNVQYCTWRYIKWASFTFIAYSRENEQLTCMNILWENVACVNVMHQFCLATLTMHDMLFVKLWFESTLKVQFSFICNSNSNKFARIAFNSN